MDFNQTYELINGSRQFNYFRCILYIQLQGRQLYGSSYYIHPSQRTQLQKLLAYATQDSEACAFYGIDLKKGLLISGPANSGKTSLLHLLKPFFEPEQQYRIRSCREVLYCYDLFGEQSLQQYGDQEVPYCFDDLGIVPGCLSTKSDFSVVREMLKLRLLSNPASTHIVTRMNPEELANRYGSHFTALLLRSLNSMEFTESFNLK